MAAGLTDTVTSTIDVHLLLLFTLRERVKMLNKYLDLMFI